MAEECTDPKNQQTSAAFPNKQRTNTGSLEVNLDATGSEIFNPNLALSAVQTFNTLNNVANRMFGIEARWFRAVPQQRSKDVIFQEYTLSSVEEDPLCLKVVVPDGNFPDSNYQYDLMGLEYQVPTEIQIDKKYWEEVAGFGTGPQKKDVVYLPLPNKLYDVESSFLKRGFMEQETTWVINLIKHQEEASRKEGDALKETIDQYTVSEKELFGIKIAADIENLTIKKQMSPLSSTSEDPYKVMDTDLKTIPYDLDVYGIIVAESIYDLNTSDSSIAVTYKNSSDIILASADRSITAWINPNLNTPKEYNILSITPDTSATYFDIRVHGTQIFNEADTFTIYRSDQLNSYATVTRVSTSSSIDIVYECKMDQPVINHLNDIQYQWWTKPNWKMRIERPITILHGRNERNTGLVATVNADQYIKINFGSQEHISIMDEKIEKGNWYGFVINIGNSWEQYNVHVWKPSLVYTDNKLQSVFYETLPFTSETIDVEEYIINKSNSYVTNIRFFNFTFEEEKQTQELLSYFTQNASRALILDNADSRLKIPYISQQR